MTHRLTIAIISLLLTAAGQGATVYQCADNHGHPIFSDSPCAASATQLDIDPAPYIGTVSTYAADLRAVTQGLNESTQQMLHNAIDLRQQSIDNLRRAMATDLARLSNAQANTDPTWRGAYRYQQLADQKQILVDQYSAHIADNQRAIDQMQAQLSN